MHHHKTLRNAGVNVDQSLSKATSLSVLLPRLICLCVGAISWVKLWLLFIFAQQKHAYSSAKQMNSRCRYSDTHENNSIPSTAAPRWLKIDNVSESLSHCPEIITFMTFSWLCNHIRKCPHHFFCLGSLKSSLFMLSTEEEAEGCVRKYIGLGQLRITVSPPGSELATFCTNQ